MATSPRLDHDLPSSTTGSLLLNETPRRSRGRLATFALLLACLPLLFAGFAPTSQERSDQKPAQQPSATETGDNVSSTGASTSNPAGEITDGEQEVPTDSEAAKKPAKTPPLFTNDAVIFGILMVMLGAIFWSANSDFVLFRWFYKVIPMLLVCYFLPSLLTYFHLVDYKTSALYTVATRYLLPASLVFLTLSIDLKAIIGLGPKALIMFLTGTFGVIVGGPLAVLLVGYFHPEIIGIDGPAAAWRGLSTVAGSWIGGGANQAAMQVLYMSPAADATLETKTELGNLFSTMVAVDVFVAEIWMMFLLLGVGKADMIDRWFKADSSSIDELKSRMESFSAKVARVPTTTDLMVIGAIGFGATAVAHFGGEQIATAIYRFIQSASETGKNAPLGDIAAIQDSPYRWLADFGMASSFFWLIVLATTIGVLLSFTPLRNYEGAGSSKIGTVFIFILVAVIGMRMDIRAVFESPGFFLVGGIWMLIHVSLLLFVGWLIRAPYFFLAVGSKANIGGAASAPVVAAAFHPALAPVGVLLAVLGYALGTYGAMLCAMMMQAATPG